MEEVKCILCGQDVRVVRGTPRIAQTCSDHRGQLPPAVAVIRDWLDPDGLAITVERNAAHAAVTLLGQAADEIEAAAKVNEQQMGALRERFDRERIAEFKGERRARLESARLLRRLVLQLQLLLPDE